jgi:hypothetical protein
VLSDWTIFIGLATMVGLLYWAYREVQRLRR